MNVMRVNEALSADEDVVREILEELGFTQLTFDACKRTFRFAREEGRNPTSMVLNLDTLSFHCFSTNSKGNLYTLIMQRKDMNFPNALKWAADYVGLDKEEYDIDIQLPFGGFFQGLVKEISEPEFSMKTYDESELDEYKGFYNTMFLKDGISFESQKKFNIGYDALSNRVTIPIYSLDNKLIGIMGRYNGKCAHEERWLPIIPCSRSLTIYGFNENYQSIQEKSMTVIFESEKSVMQCHSFGCNIALATSGCHISDTQAKHIKSMFLPKIILAYDEGLSQEDIIAEAEKLKMDNQIYKNQVGYIYDREHKYLPEGSKSSPSDLGKEVFSKLVKECVIWL